MGAGLHPVVRRGQAPGAQADLRLERIDVVTGAALTGVIGFFVVVACAATLHATGQRLNDAGDAAVALNPLAGDLASTLFGSRAGRTPRCSPPPILPLSTAYSVSEGVRARVRGSTTRSPRRRSSTSRYLGVLGLGAAFVLVPGVPLVPVLFLTQVLNAVLLLPLLVAMRALGTEQARTRRAREWARRRPARALCPRRRLTLDRRSCRGRVRPLGGRRSAEGAHFDFEVSK